MSCRDKSFTCLYSYRNNSGLGWHLKVTLETCLWAAYVGLIPAAACWISGSNMGNWQDSGSVSVPSQEIIWHLGRHRTAMCHVRHTGIRVASIFSQQENKLVYSPKLQTEKVLVSWQLWFYASVQIQSQYNVHFTCSSDINWSKIKR